jgi:type IV pilus assembly protein PilV
MMDAEAMITYHIQPSPHRAAGFTLLEVLIAVVVLSIGLLGLAGLQTTGLRNNQDAYARTQAATLANDMADRIRANMAGFNAGNYDNTAAYTTSCGTSGCSPLQMAQHDTSLWNDALATLPSGQGVVANNAGLVTVTVMWDNSRTGVTGTDCGGDPNVDLACLSVMFTP